MVYLHQFELLFECERRMKIKPKMCPANNNDSRGRHIWNQKDPEMKITLTIHSHRPRHRHSNGINDKNE